VWALSFGLLRLLLSLVRCHIQVPFQVCDGFALVEISLALSRGVASVASRTRLRFQCDMLSTHLEVTLLGFSLILGKSLDLPACLAAFSILAYFLEGPLLSKQAFDLRLIMESR
jgi:hypothetical protein